MKLFGFIKLISSIQNMEIALLILVALSFYREAKATSRSGVVWAIAGGALYACSITATKAALYQLLMNLGGNSSLFMAVDILLSNTIALVAVSWCSSYAFGANALKAEQAFKVFNWIWLILASFFATGPMLNPSSLSNFGTQIIGSLAVAVLLPAGTLFAGKRDRESGKIASPKMSILMLLLNTIVAVLVIYHFSTNELYHPIAFFIVDMYFSLWITVIALFNTVVLFGNYHSSKLMNSNQSQQKSA